MTENKRKIKLGFVVLFIPFLVVINIICFMTIKNKVTILNSNFIRGIIVLDSIDCNSISGSDGSNETCYGFGKVEKVNTKVILGKENKISFLKKSYDVFYRKDGKFTLLNLNKEQTFNYKKYKSNVFWISISVILVNITVFLIYLKLRK